jgi:hypothetical protein
MKEPSMASVCNNSLPFPSFKVSLVSPSLSASLDYSTPNYSSELPASVDLKVILGSSSPARREILADMGYEFTVMVRDYGATSKWLDL